MLPSHQIDNLYNSLGLSIREKRTDLGYSQTKFASLLGISRVSLVNIEQGRQRTPLHILYAISDLLQTDISDLLPAFQNHSEIKLSESTNKEISNLEAGVKVSMRNFIKHSKNNLK